MNTGISFPSEMDRSSQAPYQVRGPCSAGCKLLRERRNSEQSHGDQYFPAPVSHEGKRKESHHQSVKAVRMACGGTLRLVQARATEHTGINIFSLQVHTT